MVKLRNTKTGKTVEVTKEHAENMLRLFPYYTLVKAKKANQPKAD